MRLLLGCTERTDHAGIGRKGIEGARNRARRVGVVVGISIAIERALPRPGAGSGRTTTEVHFSRAIEDTAVLALRLASSNVTAQLGFDPSSNSKPL